MERWITEIITRLAHSDDVITASTSLDIAKIIVPTCLRRGYYFPYDNFKKRLRTSKEIALSDYKLTHSWGYLVSDFIEAGALLKIKECLGENFKVTAKDEGIESVKYSVFSSPNPEEEPQMAIAYARARKNIVAVYIPEKIFGPSFLSRAHSVASSSIVEAFEEM